MTTRKDVFFWELATRRAQELGFKIVTDTSDDRFHLTQTHPSYAEDNVLARLSTVTEVLAYLEGWGDSRQYLKLEAPA